MSSVLSFTMLEFYNYRTIDFMADCILTLVCVVVFCAPLTH